jgi:hypothetical protein
MTLITRLFIPSFALLAFFAVIISAEAAAPENTPNSCLDIDTGSADKPHRC